ncbi:MAG: DNA adenine methylase [Phycisphaerales bacterium]
MIKYIGSKRTLMPVILDAVRLAGGARTVVDLFSGTSRVGHALKGAGYRVVSNDHNAYAHTLARCYVQADAEDVLADAGRLVREFNGMNGEPGYFTETFCERSRYFQPKNGARIDAIREAIARKGLEPELESVMLVSLMEAADRVDSTTGLQMAYLKQWAPRAFNDLELRVPEVLPRSAHGKGEAHCMEAVEAARLLDGDVAYIDPPYNQPFVSGELPHLGVARSVGQARGVRGGVQARVDVRGRKSAFNSRPKFAGAMRELLGAVQAPVLIVSFNNEGYLSLRDGSDAGRIVGRGGGRGDDDRERLQAVRGRRSGIQPRGGGGGWATCGTGVPVCGVARGPVGAARGGSLGRGGIRRGCTFERDRRRVA